MLELGRTLETYRVLLESEQAFWLKKTKRSFEYEKLTKELLNSAQKYADAITFWSNGQVKEKILFSMLFSQYKELLQCNEKQ